MYQDFYSLKESPFNLVPDPDYLYMSSQFRQALSMLEYGLTKDGFTVITGDSGSGKTLLIRKILEKENENYTIALLNNTVIYDKSDLIEWISFSFGLKSENRNKVDLYGDLVEFLISEYREGRQCVMIIDEAHKLDAEFLEQIRMISNINYGKHLLIQFVLVGQPELRELLQQPELSQFAQRIAIDYHLQPMSEAEAQAYVNHRIAIAGGDPETFSEDARSMLWQASKGNARLLNSLGDTAMVYGFATEQKLIDVDVVKQVIQDKQGSLLPLPDKIPALGKTNQGRLGRS